MAQNIVQFQKGLSLPEFMKLYGNESQCANVIEKIKWPQGFICPLCEHHSFCFIKSRKRYQCNRCSHQTSLTANTIFHSTNLPLTTWLLAIYFLSQSKNGISALELKRQLGVQYKTAWKIKHKLAQVMLEKDESFRLSGRIELDDSYLGGERRGGKRGRGSENKQPFVAAVETTVDCKPIRVKFTLVNRFQKKVIKKWAKQHLTPNSDVITDGYYCFRAVTEAGCNHFPIVVGKERKSIEIKPFNWVNTMLGNLKRSISGTYHAARNGYAQRYLAEFQYRINRRFDLRNIALLLINDAVHTPPMPEKLLRMTANCT